MSVVGCTAQLFPPDAPIQAAEHIALANMLSAPIYALSPNIALDVLAVGARTAPARHWMAWACRLRAVLRCPGLMLAMHRLDAAIAEGRCLVPRFREWLRNNTVADLRVAHAHAPGLPQAIREHAKPQAMIITSLVEAVGVSRLSAMVSRRLARQLGEPIFAPQVGVVVCRLRRRRLLLHSPH